MKLINIVYAYHTLLSCLVWSCSASIVGKLEPSRLEDLKQKKRRKDLQVRGLHNFADHFWSAFKSRINMGQ